MAFWPSYGLEISWTETESGCNLIAEALKAPADATPLRAPGDGTAEDDFC